METKNSTVDKGKETTAGFPGSGKSPGFEKAKQIIADNEEGKVGWILLWALGIPIPILLVLFVLRGCT